MTRRPVKKALSGPFFLGLGVRGQDIDMTIRTTARVVMMCTSMLHPPLDQRQSQTNGDGSAQDQVKGFLVSHLISPTK